MAVFDGFYLEWLQLKKNLIYKIQSSAVFIHLVSKYELELNMKLDRPVHIVSASLAASSFVALTQFTGINKINLTNSIHISIVIFAITLPILSALAILPAPKNRSENLEYFYFGLIILTWITSLAGIACIFLSFALSYMLLFVASSIVSLVLLLVLADKSPSS